MHVYETYFCGENLVKRTDFFLFSSAIPLPFSYYLKNKIHEVLVCFKIYMSSI